MSEISVDEVMVEGDAAVIDTANEALCAKEISPTDDESTIQVNSILKNSYNKQKDSLSDYGTTLDEDVANIRSLNLEFVEFDLLINTINTQDDGMCITG